MTILLGIHRNQWHGFPQDLEEMGQAREIYHERIVSGAPS